MNCRDCLERMYPYDPRVPRFISLGNYSRPSCDYCSKPRSVSPPQAEQAQQSISKIQVIHHYVGKRIRGKY